MNEMDSLLAQWQYDPRWVQFGFLTREDLVRSAAGDQALDPPEHHRYASFRRVLASRSALSPTDVDRYIELAIADRSVTIGPSALRDLVEWPGLTPAQFDLLAGHPAFQEDWLQRIVTRRRLLRSLAAEPLEETLFAACMASCDGFVQRALVALPDLSTSQLTEIAVAGANRATRNLARTRLRGWS
jgi:hypothetical protein